MSGSINSVEDDRSPLLASYQPDDSYRNLSPRPSSERRVTSDGKMRQPVAYHSINSPNSSYSDHDSETSAVVSRYKYYSRLAPNGERHFAMPDHVVPSVFLFSNIVEIPGSQPSWITIFSLWNTMMGTSLLSMPWAINKAGLAVGIVLLVLMAILMLYTSYIILFSLKGMKKTSGEVIEFSDVCQQYLGRWASILALVSSLMTFLGGMIVYWILMSNFLYNIVTFIYHHTQHEGVINQHSNDPVCLSSTPSGNQSSHYGNTSHHSHDATFNKYWDEQKTVPFILILIIFPLINFKSPTFFTKFNALGTVSVTYLVCFVMKNAISWGVNVEFHDTSSPVYVYEYKNTFPALTGVAALALFIQNSVISITRTQKRPENNVRDLVIAYVLVTVTYLYMGVMVYMTFTLTKNCIEDNFLNNLQDTNLMAFVARIGLFTQMLCVFPLLVYICRVQLMNTLFGSVWPSLKYILIMNAGLVVICVMFARFFPKIGSIIGFAGAFCGFTYAIALPCLVYMKIKQLAGTLTKPFIVFHSILIVLGFANFVAQFLIL